ncbi:MAG: NADH-quinone oxidoreductase subunit D [Bacteroidetes bacterium]|nr:NADH-quinone oxidoreductase subunit D [Bacteroidota bacterium]MCA0444800.1 NADH-quinone oxidoreductase subunit D [Bacteroidota bacterium]
MPHLKTEEMIMNMGPQHPSTHGVLRLELVTDGEIVKSITPHIGYLHRCFEKHGEELTYPMIIPFTDRLDYLASMNNNHAFVLAVEKLLNLEVPRKVEFIRIIVAELQRIASHLVAIGTFGADIGAVTPFLWTFRDREIILNLFENLTGARMLYNYMWPGGVSRDFPKGFREELSAFISYFRPKIKDLNNLLTGNHIFISRTANVGILPKEVAINYNCTGPVLRGSGVNWDLRKDDPYCIYPEFEFEIPTGKGTMGTVGDTWDRYFIRCQEMEQSLNIIEQALEKYPVDDVSDVQAAVPRRIKPPVGEVYARAENPRGELGFYIISDGGTKPFRVKAKSPCFVNLAVLPALGQGIMISDIVAILGSLDIVLGEIDR